MPQRREPVAPPRGWLVVLALYAALTVWIIVGRDLAAESAFTVSKNLGYLVVAAIGVWVFRGSLVAGWRRTTREPARAVTAVIVALALMGVASGVSQLVVTLVGSPPTGVNQAAIAAEVHVASQSFLAGALFLGIGGLAAPLIEESVFRELPLRPRRGPRGTGVVVILSSLAFGAIHLRHAHEWPLGLLYVGYGAALATAYLLSRRNLLVPLAAHVLWNGIGLAFLLITA